MQNKFNQLLKDQSIREDLKHLNAQGLSISILFDELKDDPDAYNYDADDLQNYLYKVENPPIYIQLKETGHQNLDSFSGAIIPKPEAELDIYPTEEDVQFLADLLAHAYNQCYYIIQGDDTLAEDLEEDLAPEMANFVTKLGYYAGLTKETNIE